MTLKAIIPKGQTELTVNGLHQWDYGRKLEIHSDELPAVVEVHFACAGMKDAVVRVCEAVDGVATAVIPDRCLEQTAPITAWVYVIDDTAGFTAKTITLPIIPRTKPQPSGTVPEEYTDKYTEAITAVNEAAEKLASGEVKVGSAYEADHATRADSATTASTATVANHAATATNADEATHATSADTATTATSADTATTATSADTADAIGASLVATVTITDGIGDKPSEVVEGAFYLVIFEEANATHSGVFYRCNNRPDVIECSLGSCTMAFLSGSAGSHIRVSSGTGTLNFYKLGGIG